MPGGPGSGAGAAPQDVSRLAHFRTTFSGSSSDAHDRDRDARDHADDGSAADDEANSSSGDDQDASASWSRLSVVEEGHSSDEETMSGGVNWRRATYSEGANVRDLRRGILLNKLSSADPSTTSSDPTVEKTASDFKAGGNASCNLRRSSTTPRPHSFAESSSTTQDCSSRRDSFASQQQKHVVLKVGEQSSDEDSPVSAAREALKRISGTFLVSAPEHVVVNIEPQSSSSEEKILARQHKSRRGSSAAAATNFNGSDSASGSDLGRANRRAGGTTESQQPQNNTKLRRAQTLHASSSEDDVTVPAIRRANTSAGITTEKKSDAEATPENIGAVDSSLLKTGIRGFDATRNRGDRNETYGATDTKEPGSNFSMEVSVSEDLLVPTSPGQRGDYLSAIKKSFTQKSQQPLPPQRPSEPKAERRKSVSNEPETMIVSETGVPNFAVFTTADYQANTSGSNRASLMHMTRSTSREYPGLVHSFSGRRTDDQIMNRRPSTLMNKFLTSAVMDETLRKLESASGSTTGSSEGVFPNRIFAAASVRLQHSTSDHQHPTLRNAAPFGTVTRNSDLKDERPPQSWLATSASKSASVPYLTDEELTDGAADACLATKTRAERFKAYMSALWQNFLVLCGKVRIDPQSWFFKIWRGMMNLLHCIQIILIPLQIAWTLKFFSYESNATSYWLGFQIFFDMLCLLDCFLRCFLQYNNEYGVHVSDQKSMRAHFLWQKKGWLKIFASLPLQVFVLGNTIAPVDFDTGYHMTPETWVYEWKIWSLICFVKMLLVTPVKQLYNIEIPKLPIPMSRLIKTMIILMLMGHIDACFFWFLEEMISPGNRWVDQTNLISTETKQVTFLTQYLNSYLSALRSLVLKLREVTRDEENFFVIFEFVCGILAYGTVFGNIHSILQMMDKSAASNQADERHEFEIEWVKNYMRQKAIEPEIQRMVLSHKKLQWERSKGMDESVMFSDLPKAVHQQIKNFLYLDLVRKVPIFKDCDSAFHNLITFNISSIHVLDGWYIFRKGDEGEEMYFIKSGKVAICGEDGTVFVTLNAGAFFGEIALFEACKRTASAKAVGNVELCTLKKEDFNYIMDMHPSVALQIKETIRKRKEQEEEAKRKKAEEEALKAAAEAAKRAPETEEAARRLRIQKSKSSRLFHGGNASKRNSVFEPMSTPGQSQGRLAAFFRGHGSVSSQSNRSSMWKSSSMSKSSLSNSTNTNDVDERKDA